MINRLGYKISEINESCMWFPKAQAKIVKCFILSNQLLETQIYYKSEPRTPTNPHSWEAETSEFLNFCLKQM